MSAMTITSPTRPRLDSIDGLRGLACLMVLLYHSCDHFGKAAWPVFRLGPIHLSQVHFFAYGYGGVDLFFVLSGFCLAYPIVSRPERPVNWKQYFVHRVRRILPPYWAALLLFGLASLAIRHWNVEPFASQHIVDWPGARQIAYSALLISTCFNSSFWTLPVEWRWYFLLPALVWLWRRLGAGAVLLCTLPVSLLSISILQPSHQERLEFLLTNLPTFFPLFGLGLWAAALAGQPNRPSWERQIVRLAPWGVAAAAVSVLAYAPLWMSAFTSENALLRLATWGPLCFFLTLAATQEGRIKKWLSWRPLVTLGLFSYSLYLLHEPFLRAAGALILPRHWPAPVQFLFQTALLPAAAIGLAYVFFLLFEKPWLRRKQSGRSQSLKQRLLSQAAAEHLAVWLGHHYPTWRLTTSLCYHAGEAAFWNAPGDATRRAALRGSGGVMEVTLEEHSFREMYFFGTYEPDVTTVIKHLAKPGQKWLDVGANIGYFTILLSALVGPDGEVHAFEPNPVMVCRLERSLRQNGANNVFLNPCAVSNVSGVEVTLYVPLSHCGQSGQASLLRHQDIAESQMVSVTTTTLDAYLAPLEQEIDFMKIDVEGLELLVFQGMKEAFARRRPKIIIAEVSHLPDCLAPPRQLIGLLIQAGYCPYRIRKQGLFAYDESYALDAERDYNFLFALPEATRSIQGIIRQKGTYERH